jgi:hypothetical protein
MVLFGLALRQSLVVVESHAAHGGSGLARARRQYGQPTLKRELVGTIKLLIFTNFFDKIIKLYTFVSVLMLASQINF